MPASQTLPAKQSAATLQPQTPSFGRRAQPRETPGHRNLPAVQGDHPAMQHPDHPAPRHLRCKTAGSAGTSAPDAEESRTDPGKTCRGNPVRELVILPIRAYRCWITPLFPPCCRFTPTCSQYAIEAVRVHGILRGLALTSWRILRCNPWCRGGYDPVPPKHSGKE